MARPCKVVMVQLILLALLLFLPPPASAASLTPLSPQERESYFRTYKQPQGDIASLPPQYRRSFFRELTGAFVRCGSHAFLYSKDGRTLDDDNIYYYNSILHTDMQIKLGAKLLSLPPPPGKWQCSASGDRVVLATDDKGRHAHWILFDARQRKSYELTTDLPVVLSPSGNAIVFWSQDQIGGTGRPAPSPETSSAARAILDYYDLTRVKQTSLGISGYYIYPNWLDETHFGFFAGVRYVPPLKHNSVVIFNTRAQSSETFAESGEADWIESMNDMLRGRFPESGCTVSRDSWTCSSIPMSILRKGRGKLPGFDLVMPGAEFYVLVRERFRGVNDVSYISANVRVQDRQTICSKMIYIVSSSSEMLRDTQFNQKFTGEELCDRIWTSRSPTLRDGQR